jgi:hypothetical protein
MSKVTTVAVALFWFCNSLVSLCSWLLYRLAWFLMDWMNIMAEFVIADVCRLWVKS